MLYFAHTDRPIYVTKDLLKLFRRLLRKRKVSGPATSLANRTGLFTEYILRTKCSGKNSGGTFVVTREVVPLLGNTPESDSGSTP